MRRVCLIYRRDADTPSIERVFSVLSNEIKKEGMDVLHTRLPFGNGPIGIIGNLLFFRPPRADILHITGHVHYIALRLPANKTVLTVHDLGILRAKAGLRLKLIKKLFFDWPFKRIQYLTSVSEATKLDMIRATGCEPEKIIVIDDPVDPIMESAEKRFNMVKPAVLQIGTAPHKNLERLVTAVKGLQCRLIVVGNITDIQLEQIEASGVEFELLIAKTDEEMREVYGRCDIVAFCSTFEGFGLPIIEAQSMGIPLITSNLPPMNDIAGPGALKVDPFDVEQIRSAIETMISDSTLRENLIAEGKKNVARFNSTKIARDYVSLYDRIGVNT
jgi:glycosyltransferase involved in cell wall biosynthesis